MNYLNKAITLLLSLVLASGMAWAGEADDSSDEALAQKPFLGVEVGSVSNQLRHHLDLDEDVGISVNYVVPDSAAEKAGLQRYDIMTHYNDQLILAQSQFSALLRRTKPGEPITMMVLRKGEKVVLQGNMGSRLDQQRSKAKEKSFQWVPDMDFMQDAETQEAIAAAMERASEAMVIAEDALAELKDNPELREEIERGYAEAVRAIEEASKQMHENEEWKKHFETAKQAMKMQIHKMTAPEPPQPPEAPHAPYSYSMSTERNANIVFEDNEGTLILNVGDGNKTLTALDKDGTLLFTGPINTPEEMELIPPSVRTRMEKVEGIQIESDGTFQAPKIEVIVPDPDVDVSHIYSDVNEAVIVVEKQRMPAPEAVPHQHRSSPVPPAPPPAPDTIDILGVEPGGETL